MRRIFFSFLAFMASVTTLMADCITPSTATATVTLTRRTGEFSVSATRKVSFSPGNLQYQASTNTWRFAPQQYSYVGNAVGNTNPTSTQSGWIDLFGWGTSGWDNTAVDAKSTNYQPWATDKTDNGASQSPQWDNRYGYGPSITTVAANASWATNSNYDWGVYNAAQLGSGWRTLSQAEWTYILSTRTNASSKYGLATANGVNGLVLLPDSWTLPDGCSFTAGTAYGFSTNSYTDAQWTLMEANGAIFLPCAGYRDATTMNNVGSEGNYWESTTPGDYGAWDLRIAYDNVQADHWTSRYIGFSVRLVQDL